MGYIDGLPCISEKPAGQGPVIKGGLKTSRGFWKKVVIELF